ncbi:Unknown protein [Striga hermonthica]|uniref:BED-type domain-containing protein n=1 Tax=Striga hermonthica TaxID=68872 RepID=A0A9N7ND37_STRHE|nr:Unknown protein [Striga hermonthica]
MSSPPKSPRKGCNSGTKRKNGGSGPSGCSRTSSSSTLRRASSDDPQPELGSENATFEEEPVETSNAYEDEEGESDERDDGVPRKKIKRRVEAWKHFDLIRDKNGMQRAKCKHCEKSYAAHTKLNGTSSMNHHMSKCKGHPKR